MSERIILHSDMNGFYAAVECLYNPDIREKPVVVAGDVEARHGIVLASNQIAKKYGIKTGNPLFKVKQVCPDAVFVPPHFDRYLKFSRLARQIYSEYTDRVEAFGLDEAWLDVTESAGIFGDGEAIANIIRERIKDELGVTVSIGVSFNKIFAKLGSDMKKPDAVTIITRENFRKKVWCLPVNDLLYIGRATHKKMNRIGVFTIGELAECPVLILEQTFGKLGPMLWRFANGLDDSPVANIEAKLKIKSVGNSTTTPRDLTTVNEVQLTFQVLAESVSARLREQDFVCRTVQIGIRDNDLHWIERQAKLAVPNRTAEQLLDSAMALFTTHYDLRYDKPIRSLSLKACDLDEEICEQLTFMSDIKKLDKEEKLESAIDKLRSRYGHFAVQRGVSMTDKSLTGLDPKSDHVIHPVSFLK